MAIIVQDLHTHSFELQLDELRKSFFATANLQPQIWAIYHWFLNISGSGELEFEEFCILAARFLIEEDEEQMRKELKEAFRFYDKEGTILSSF